ncbi:helix-hairpin-helix domain-containing protein [Snuella sp. CAU 1569]|uniref:Helix-hairpin-helix domain-containing protein n=1 Tax=Snuella sedimenti TaxID=2798802 RepID=A0A8J7IY77_9FLAO|nr:helix-hairpin-helix domain-containing protein [Snuella sedimenti]
MVLVIVGLQCLCFYLDFSSSSMHENEYSVNFQSYTNEVDSLRHVKQVDKPKIYPFNPNFITDYKGSILGMSNKEIDRLLAFRKENKWINSAKQFQDVTHISDSLLNTMVPFFKFPEWAVKSKPKKEVNYESSSTTKTYAQKLDLNTATSQQLQKVNGIGKVLSERIVKYRNGFIGGFIADVQLQDVYGLTPEVIERITNEFTVKTPRRIQKVALNIATVENLVTIQHIDYDLAYQIVEQRQLREGYESLDELTKVKGFPINKIEIIKLYLSLD